MKKFLLLLSVLHVALQGEQTSVSDNGSYPQFCMQAAQDPTVFKNFRRSQVYQIILEHTTYEQGKKYLHSIQKNAPEFLKKIPFLKEQDLVGNPLIYSYGSCGKISPTTLRYIKVASDLVKLFGSLDQFHIVEIGGGYGGQRAVIEKLFRPRSYTIIDLPGPLELTKKFLKTQNITWGWFLKPGQLPLIIHYDLVISNYAFSECSTEMQEKYMQNILFRSKRGYITCNQIGGFLDPSKRCLSKKEFLLRLKKAHIPFEVSTEKPLTAENNYLITWKNYPRVPQM